MSFKGFFVTFCLVTLCNCGGGYATKGPQNGVDKNGNSNRSITVHPISAELSAETVGKIRQDFSNYEINRVGYAYPDITASNVYVLDYYGTYNNSVVVKMTRSGPTIELPDIIIGETVLPKAIAPIIVWKEGQIYELRNAYDQGLLTMENLRSVAYYIWGRELNLESHAGLIRPSLNGIISAYRSAYVVPYFPEAVFTDIHIENYYGSYKYFETGAEVISLTPSIYNDHVAVMINSNYEVHFDEYREETVAGTQFQYINSKKILLWKTNRDDWWNHRRHTGRFYELQEAYGLGILTEDDIRSIAYYHETGKTISYTFNQTNY